MRVLILTEGGKSTGFGHVARCLALRDALTVKGMNASVIVNGDSLVRKQFRGQFTHVFDWLADKPRTMKLVTKADVVAIDSYHAPLDLCRKISKAVTLPIFIDDYARLAYPPGIVINGAVDAEKFRYPKGKNRRHLLGAKYALLRKDFWQVPKKITRAKIRNVLVTFGGMDRSVFIHSLLAYLQPRFPDFNFHVVTARPCRYSVRHSKKIRYYAGIKAQKMKELIGCCDIAISGGGQTLNELAVCGLPTVGVCLAENQKMNIQGWQQQGFLKYAGDSSDSMLPNRIAMIIRALNRSIRERMSAVGRKLIDGHGSERAILAVFAAQKK